MRTDEYSWADSGYYDQAEATAQHEFRDIIRPRLPKWGRPAVLLDFACGHGRMVPYLAPLAERLILCDVSADAIRACRRRFGYLDSVECLVNDLTTVPLPDASVAAVFSWDAMVHFDYRALEAYAAEFARIMAPGAFGFVHHSNYGAAGGDWMENPGYRAPTDAEGVRERLEAAGLSVVTQTVIDWSKPGLDCLTTFQTS